MHLDTTTALVTAFYATATQTLGLAFLKSASGSMPPLHGTRPVELLRSAVTDRVWLCGGAVMLCGTGLQYETLAALPLHLAVPAFLAGSLPLLPLAAVFFGERPNPRDLVLVALLAAVVVTAVDVRAATLPEPVVYLLSLAGPLAAFSVCELARTGHHARPLSGVAHGASAGVLLGTAELALKSAADGGPPLPHLALFLFFAALGAAQLQITLQRTPLLRTGLLTITIAKAHLVLTTALIFR